MTHKDGESFASKWAVAWNQRNVEAVLEHFHEDIVFTSPTAIAVVKVPTVNGKEALRTYWLAALARCNSLKFTVDHILWDPACRELAIIYTADIDGKSKRVSENYAFDENGLVISAEVFHGVPALK